jgi:DNA-binding protein
MPKEAEEPQQTNSDNSVFIGKRPTMNYVMASMMILNAGQNCTIKARGRSISHAVDVAEILKNKFVPLAKYHEIRLSTEQLTNSDGKVSNVSSIEIEISPK